MGVVDGAQLRKDVWRQLGDVRERLREAGQDLDAANAAVLEAEARFDAASAHVSELEHALDAACARAGAGGT
jgi:hypothetical protein